MLDENIKQLRKAKGLSQEELAIKLNVVRQTVSKWENGLSVPDSSMLISLADEFGVSVSDLLGEAISESASDELRAISEKLEVINLQLSKQAFVESKNHSLVAYLIVCIYGGNIYCFCRNKRLLYGLELQQSRTCSRRNDPAWI